MEVSDSKPSKHGIFNMFATKGGELCGGRLEMLKQEEVTSGGATGEDNIGGVAFLF
jgi:hypothetical protein